MYFLWYLLIGLAAGWIANLIVKGGGSGLFVNLIVGLIGGVLGGWLFSLFGWVPVGTLGSLATAVIGSVIRTYARKRRSHDRLFVLSCRDSNPERQNQNLLCYHYTTAQTFARKRLQR